MNQLILSVKIFQKKEVLLSTFFRLKEFFTKKLHLTWKSLKLEYFKMDEKMSLPSKKVFPENVKL